MASSPGGKNSNETAGSGTPGPKLHYLDIKHARA
jgi:hypothetical protein